MTENEATKDQLKELKDKFAEQLHKEKPKTRKMEGDNSGADEEDKKEKEKEEKKGGTGNPYASVPYGQLQLSHRKTGSCIRSRKGPEFRWVQLLNIAAASFPEHQEIGRRIVSLLQQEEKLKDEFVILKLDVAREVREENNVRLNAIERPNGNGNGTGK